MVFDAFPVLVMTVVFSDSLFVFRGNPQPSAPDVSLPVRTLLHCYCIGFCTFYIFALPSVNHFVFVFIHLNRIRIKTLYVLIIFACKWSKPFVTRFYVERLICLNMGFEFNSFTTTAEFFNFDHFTELLFFFKKNDGWNTS